MKIKIVNISEVMDTQKNPTLCLSPHRYFMDCHKCTNFQNALRKHKYDIETTIKLIPCKPQLRKSFIELCKQKQKLLEELRKIEEKIKEDG